MRNILNMRILSRFTIRLYLSDAMHSLAGIDYTTIFYMYIYMVYMLHIRTYYFSEYFIIYRLIFYYTNTFDNNDVIE